MRHSWETTWLEEAYYSPPHLRRDALEAAQDYDDANGGSGLYDYEEYDLDIVAFPRLSFWNWDGSARIGERRLLLNGDFRDTLTIHEIGHNLGLYHSNFWHPYTDDPIGSGFHLEYGALVDIMGRDLDLRHHYNAWFKQYLGWLDEGEDWMEVSETGTYRIYRHDHDAAEGLRAIKIPIDDERDYWLDFQEYSARAGGVTFRWGMKNAAGEMDVFGARMLEMTPPTAESRRNFPLLIGASFSDVALGVHVTPLAVGGDDPHEFVDVEIRVEPPPVIVVHPAATVGFEEGVISLTVEAEGPSPFTYQWLKDGEAIPGATEATLQLEDLLREAEGNYSVIVTNRYTSVTSAEAAVTIYPRGYRIPGSIDLTFEPEIDGPARVYAIQQLSDGKILVGGPFTSATGRRIARLHPDGSIDDTFSADLHRPGDAPFVQSTRRVWAINELPDRRILVAGDFYEVNGVVQPYLTILHPNGELDVSFTPEIDEPVMSICHGPEGVLIGGIFKEVEEEPAQHLARLHYDGTLDHSFFANGAPDDLVRSIQKHNGGYLVSGIFQSFQRQFDMSHVALIDNRGNPDQLFHDNIAILEWEWFSGIMNTDFRGRIIGIGRVGTADSRYEGMFRLLHDGRIDDSFSSGTGRSHVSVVDATPNGKVLIGGGFFQIDEYRTPRIGQLFDNGLPDVAFQSGFRLGDRAQVSVMETQNDGRILLGGNFNMYAGISRPSLVRIYGDMDQNLFPNWAMQHRIFAARGAYLLDPDGHDIPLLLRYAFFTDAHKPDPEQLPQLEIRPAEDGSTSQYLAVSFRRLPFAQDLQYTVQASSDLVGWQDLPESQIVAVEEAEPGVELVTFQDIVTLDSRTRRFLRVKVTYDPE